MAALCKSCNECFHLMRIIEKILNTAAAGAEIDEF